MSTIFFFLPILFLIFYTANGSEIRWPLVKAQMIKYTLEEADFLSQSNVTTDIKSQKLMDKKKKISLD